MESAGLAHCVLKELKLLLDTNIIIPLEPTGASNVEPNTLPGTQLFRAAQHSNAQMFIHPEQYQDIKNDQDTARKELRHVLVGKYLELPFPPSISPEIEMVIGKCLRGTNDWVDHHLLAAVKSHSVDYLVSEDANLHKKASKLKISEKVLRLQDAVDALEALFTKPTKPPPSVQYTLAHTLNDSDPIWESFRNDYRDFNSWLERCKKEHRPCWIIEGEASYAGVAILKPEDHDLALRGRVAKICSFKVDEDQRGLRYGELLLKSVFAYSLENKHDWLYVTVFEKQDHLIAFLQEFGFRAISFKNERDELILLKPLNTQYCDEDLSGLEFNIRFGPYQVDLDHDIFAVPILPRYHQLLFPDLEVDQRRLIEGEFPFGNSIRKAYLCHSPSTRLLPGSIVAFYRSRDIKALTCLGVVEETVRSSDPNVIASTVGKRTVYTYHEIEDLCERGEVLAILFRQAIPFSPVIRLKELVDASMLKSAPVSITRLPENARSWMKKLIRL